MSETKIANIVSHFGISPEWIPAYDALVNYGRVTNVGFGRLIRREGRFRDALDMMKDVLSEQFIRLFSGDIAQMEQALAIAE